MVALSATRLRTDLNVTCVRDEDVILLLCISNSRLTRLSEERCNDGLSNRITTRLSELNVSDED